MLVKDQLKVRMDQLEISITELAQRVGVRGTSVRHWLNGRNYPTKAKTFLLEEALSFKLDFSEGEPAGGPTVQETLRGADVNTLLALSKLPPDIRLAISQLTETFARALKQHPGNSAA